MGKRPYKLWVYDDPDDHRRYSAYDFVTKDQALGFVKKLNAEKSSQNESYDRMIMRLGHREIWSQE